MGLTPNREINLKITKKRNKHVKTGFISDLIETKYCCKEELDEVLEDLLNYNGDIIPVLYSNTEVLSDRDYFIATVGNSNYFVAGAPAYYNPNNKEDQVFKIERIDRDNDLLFMKAVESNKESPLVQEIYSVLTNYYNEMDIHALDESLIREYKNN